MSNIERSQQSGQRLTVYTGNHVSYLGISDIVELVTEAGRAASVTVTESGTLEGDVILFIDEFSSYFELKSLLRDKLTNSQAYILLCTEFETNAGDALSFNEFNHLNVFTSSVIGILAHLLFYYPKALRKSRIIRSILTLFFLPVLVVLGIVEFPRTMKLLDFLKSTRRAIYMRSRRKGYEIFKKNCDMVLKIHPLVDEAQDRPVLYPLLDGILNSTSKKIRVSGTETRYRLDKCYEFARKLREQLHGYELDFSGRIRFDTKVDKDKWSFSYQPTQSSSWEMANPVKIWRDIQLHHALPIVDRKFGQHPIEHVAILSSSFLCNAFSRKSIEAEIEKYNMFALSKNATVFKEMTSVRP